MNTDQNLWHTNHVTTVARRTLTHVTLTAMRTALRAIHTVPADDWTHTHTQMNNERVQFLGSAEQLQKRRISEATNSFYRIYRHGNTLRFPYYNESGQVVGFKIKNKVEGLPLRRWKLRSTLWPASFPHQRKTNRHHRGRTRCCLLLRSYVRLAHGQPTSWCGSSQERPCRKPYPSCKATKRSSLFFDNDEAGREAVESASSILPAGRVKIARLDAYKDASDALQAEDREAIRRAIWDAKPYRPDGIVDGKNLMALVTEPTKTCDHEYPFEGLNDKLHGIRYGELNYSYSWVR